MNVLIALNINRPGWDPPQGELRKLVRRFPKVNFSTTISEADVIFGWMIDPASLRMARNLKWFHTAGVQYGHLFPREIYDRAVVTNSRGVWAEHITEKFFGALNGVKLNGKTAGIVGLGGIGSRIAKEARKLKMKVIATNNAPEELGKILKSSDIIFLTAPHTERTDGLFNEKEFGLMKNGVMFLSSSRPGLVNGGALKRALKKGRVGLAVIDDLWPKDMQRLKNVVTLPHSSPEHYNVWPKMFKIFGDNLKRFASGRPLKNRMHP